MDTLTHSLIAFTEALAGGEQHELVQTIKAAYAAGASAGDLLATLGRVRLWPDDAPPLVLDRVRATIRATASLRESGPKRRAPVPDEEIVRRLNELLEAERASVEGAALLERVDAKGITDTELRRFREDAEAGCVGLRQAILRYGGHPSDRTGDFARKLAALQTEGDRLALSARGAAWVVKRLDTLLGMPLESETRAFLVELLEQHMEIVDACHRRAEELAAAPSPPYRDLSFAGLREAHDRLYYGLWRRAAATDRDVQRACFQLGRYLGVLAQEVHRARSLEARSYLAKARAAYATADPRVYGNAALLSLDKALSYAHSALNSLLFQYRAPCHDGRAFEACYEVVRGELM